MKQNYVTMIGTDACPSFPFFKLSKAIWSLPLLFAIFLAGCQKDASPVHLSKSISPSTLAVTGNANPAPVDLGTAADFTILSETGISTTGVTSITGDIGVSPIAATAITGFSLTKDPSNWFSTSPIVVGKIYAANYAAPTPSKMTTAVADMKTAFTTAADLTVPAAILNLGAGNISGKTLTSGLYKWTTGVLITNVGVTLSGSASDVWIFQIAQNLTVNNSAIVHLSGGAQAKNVFWIVSGKSTLGTSADFSGNILCKTLIALNTGATVNGRLLAQTAVTLIASTVDPKGQASVSPNSGIVYTAVTISGSNFSTTAANNIVKFNGIAAVVNSATASQLVVTVPLGATSGKITITANGETSTSVNDFQVLQIVNEGSITPGGSFTVGSMGGDKSGNTYGTATTTDAKGNVLSFVFKYNKGVITHIYDCPAGGYSLSNLIVNPQGYINVARNYQNGTTAITEILKIVPSGQVSVFVGGNPGIKDTNGANTTEYTDIYSMVADPQGDLYVATSNELKEITPQGVITTIPGVNPGGAKYMATDAYGDLYYSSGTSVKKVTQRGSTSTVFSENSPILAIITDASSNVFVSTGAPLNKVFIVNQADAVNGKSFPAATTFLTDNQGNFYTVGSSITHYIFK